MTELTEGMRELGLTPELLKKWQQDEDEVPEPSWYVTPRDNQLLAHRKAEGEATSKNGHAHGTAPIQKPKTRHQETLAK